MAQLYERLVIPCRVTVTHQKSSATTQPRADFICTTGAQQFLKQAQTYLATAQDISLIHDRGHVVVNTGNYTQLWHSSVKFLILKVHLEKWSSSIFIQQSVWTGLFSRHKNVIKQEYPQQNIWGKIWEVFQHYFSFQINLCIGQKLWLLKPTVMSWIYTNQNTENESTNSRDALDLLLSGMQDHVRCRGGFTIENSHCSSQVPPDSETALGVWQTWDGSLLQNEALSSSLPGCRCQDNKKCNRFTLLVWGWGVVFKPDCVVKTLQRLYWVIIKLLLFTLSLKPHGSDQISIFKKWHSPLATYINY